ncbi:SAM-dependent methyltransferase [Oceanicola sp. 22II-s10i]|uniref:peptide chain release factor N(5)-glutamine methyltransferase n=1 Tax=Oceanicola sp. 22II-s10i TaxID=1317116 RepID=UPI000B524DCF|nr:peptide chain release factor N(5)-glutamine methyltransferase [Oceanicola sp. 22II-s10i]OWU84978.1 SAM-dependent methyltransferase [Oceanicola sp. 22II-s10i]
MTEAGRRLTAAGIENGQGDALALMAHAYGGSTPRYALMGALRDPLPDAVAARFEAAVAARLKRQPVSQITGYRQFWKHRFAVTRDTLDPRPDTETLVAAALEVPFDTVLDLGTGTGCILLSVLGDRPGATGTGTDLSDAALAVAQRNAGALGLTERATLIRSDWFAQVRGRFDLILSNPPYITEAEMADLAPEVRDWEPHLALTPGGDGLEAYRTIAEGASAHLTGGGHLMVEIGLTQGAAVAEVFAAAGLTDIRILPDLDGRDRVVAAKAP